MPILVAFIRHQMLDSSASPSHWPRFPNDQKIWLPFNGLHELWTQGRYMVIEKWFGHHQTNMSEGN
jgi:hypothetical protein